MELYIPREIDDIFRRAMIPEFPSLFKDNPKDVFQAEYSCKNFFVHVFMAQDKEAFDEIDFSFEEMEFIDARFQQAIGNWLMDKKAQLGNDEITGNLDLLAKDIFGQHKVRPKDRETVLINLKSLTLLSYYVCFKSRNKNIECSFCLISYLEYDIENHNFVAILGGNVVGNSLVSQVVNETYGKPLANYTTKTRKDIYPRQDRYEFNMRQYLATIKNSKIIKRTGAGYLLEQFGYPAYGQGYSVHGKEVQKKYRNKDAGILIQKYINLAKEYNVAVQPHEGTELLDDIRDGFYSTTPRNAVDTKVPPQVINGFAKILAKFIKKTDDIKQPHDAMYLSLAKKFIRRHGFKEVKNAYDAKMNAGGKFTFKDLKAMFNSRKA